MTVVKADASAALSLLSAAAVRERAHQMLLALGDQLPNFRVDLGSASTPRSSS